MNRKYAVCVGLVVLAALSLSSVASADAAVLCKQNLTTCGSANEWPAGTTFSASIPAGSPAVMQNSITNWYCRKGTLNGTTGAAGQVTINSATLQECASASGTACTATAINLPWNLETTGGYKGNGVLRGSGSGGKAPGFAWICGFQISCTFSFAAGPGANELQGQLVGGNPAKFNINQNMARSGGFCPTTATLVAGYTVTSPSPLYVASS